MDDDFVIDDSPLAQLKRTHLKAFPNNKAVGNVKIARDGDIFVGVGERGCIYTNAQRGRFNYHFTVNNCVGRDQVAACLGKLGLFEKETVQEFHDEREKERVRRRAKWTLSSVTSDLKEYGIKVPKKIRQTLEKIAKS